MKPAKSGDPWTVWPGLPGASWRGRGTSAPSPYFQCGPRLVERTFSAIPLLPASKCPGNFVNGEWRPLFDWSRFCDRLPTEIEISHWSSMAGCGVGLAATHGINFADIDTIKPENQWILSRRFYRRRPR